MAKGDDVALTPVGSFLDYARRRHVSARVLLLATAPARERTAASGVALVEPDAAESTDVVLVAQVTDAVIDSIAAL